LQIPILRGVLASESANLIYSYPVNMVPVVMASGISAGYLRTADGARVQGAGAGSPRGGINWNGVLYRVSGTKLVRINSLGQGTVVGDVGTGGRVMFAYSFDRLAIASGGRLYYWNGTTLTQVTDVDLGTALAVVWIDGYFMTTDGTYMIVTELNDPMSVNPLKYGSSEIDPDPVMTILKLRNEIAAVNRYTIEYFNNVGGTLFPFQRIEGAQIQKGALGTSCACIFNDTVAFLGSGKNETPAIYLGVNGGVSKISSSGIDAILNAYAEVDLAVATLETHIHQSHPQLWVRLSDRTLVYDADASAAAGDSVWFQLTSAKTGFTAYRIVDLVWCYDQWTVCDASTGNFGVITPESAHQFGDVVRWEFAAALAYNDGKGAIWNKLELVCLPGRVAEGEDPVISTNYSLDGEMWSELRTIRAGERGDRTRRLVWFQQGAMRNWRIQRFEGDSRARIAIVRLEVQMEPLSV
jgi:hypothetical protein